MIIYGNELIKIIRNEFDNAKSRIWIAVPFIGEWEAVKRIMGTNWITDDQINIRIITDIRNEDFINSETIKQFLHRASVKTLAGLHAKIYIIDNSVFITSANLTGTAFSRRYEICEYFKIAPSHTIISVFNDWWKISKNVNSSWTPTKKGKTKDNDAGNTDGLKILWELPKGAIRIKNFKDYQDSIVLYNHFKATYEGLDKRILPKLPVYHELDAFLNFLFHEQKNRPSYKYLKNDFRKLSDPKKIFEIKKYKKEFKIRISKNKTFENYRFENIKKAQDKLSKSNLGKMTRKDLESVINCLHTMNSHPLNRFKFLNPKNNNLKDIKEAFDTLIHGDKVIEERMELCNDKLKSFGKSSIRELVSWYYPDKYPIMNRNSNCGLKFFGYDIKTY